MLAFQSKFAQHAVVLQVWVPLVHVQRVMFTTNLLAHVARVRVKPRRLYHAHTVLVMVCLVASVHASMVKYMLKLHANCARVNATWSQTRHHTLLAKHVVERVDKVHLVHASQVILTSAVNVQYARVRVSRSHKLCNSTFLTLFDSIKQFSNLPIY